MPPPLDCPLDAWWSESDREWVHGPKDDQGRLQGLVRYWNADGALISEAEHLDGRPHGSARRYHPDGSLAQECRYVDGVLDGPRRWFRPTGETEDDDPLEQAAASVAVYECVYERGDLINTTWRDADGREVDLHGQPIPARPPGVPPTATPFQGGWLPMRRRGEHGEQTLELREYFGDGTLRRERLADGSERAFYPDGGLRSQREGGEDRRYDASGFLRCVDRGSSRTWHRPASEGATTCRSGPVDRWIEFGTWEVRDPEGAVVERVRLGDRQSDEALLADPAAAADRVDPAPPEQGDDAARVLSRIRAAGRAGDRAALEAALGPDPPWRALDDQGGPAPLASALQGPVQMLHALRWGLDPALLGELGAMLFRARRPHAALDVLDAARVVGDDPSWQPTRLAILRTLGLEGSSPAGPQALDPRSEELLLMIRAAPDDDGPRLVFADYVADRLPEHSALIVAQCAGREDQALLEALHRSLPPAVADEAWACSRGFVESPFGLLIDAEIFVAHPDLLFRLYPTADALDLEFATDHVATLCTLPALRRYHAITFSDTYLREGAPHLAASPHLGGLLRLGLRDTGLNDEGLLAILRSTAFPRLEELEIGNGREGQRYGLEAFRALGEAAFAPTLRSLNIDRRWFDEQVVEVLARLPRLEQLSAEGSRLGLSGIRALARLPHRFVSLNLNHSDLGPEAGEILAGSPILSSLRDLDLGSNPLGERGLIAIVRSGHLGGLRRLSLSGGLSGGSATAAVAGAFAGTGLVETLEDLSFSLARIGPGGATALAGAGFRRLRRLDLYGNGIGDPGGVALARSPLFGTLQYLNLGNNGIGDPTGQALAEAPEVAPQLWLELGGATFSDPIRARLLERFGDRVQLEHPWHRGG